MYITTGTEIYFTGLLLEAFLYGLYSGIFAMYLKYQASRKDTSKTQNIIFYSICSLYGLSVAVFACDIAKAIYEMLDKPPDSLLRIVFILGTSFGCCDFIAQFILIYRCWIVWGCNIRVVIMPSILAFAFLAIWLACSSSAYISSDGLLEVPEWAYQMSQSGFALSLAVNALVTGLIVFRIFKVFRGAKATSEDQILGITGGTKFRRTILILIESGMALFSIQLARLVVTVMWTDAAIRADNIIVGVHEMLNGITPTIILVRISMGLSFNDEKSMEEVVIGSLRFSPNHPNSVPEIGSISIGSQDRRDDDDIDANEVTISRI